MSIEWTARPFSAGADIPRLLTLLAETEAADGEGNELAEEQLRQTLNWPGHDPARDRLVIEEPGNPDKLIGYALLWKMPHESDGEAHIVIHPAWRRRGIGTALLSDMLARCRELGAVTLRAYANVKHPAVGAFLQRHSFAPVSAYTLFEAASDPGWAAPAWPDGYAVCTYPDLPDGARFATLLGAINRCYEGLVGHHHVTEEAAQAWFPQMPKDGVFLLFAPDGDVAGICRAETLPQGAGHLDAPGVVPEHRSHSLYLPLLLTATAWLWKLGASPIHVESWGDAPETLALYEVAGFQVARKETIYSLMLGT